MSPQQPLHQLVDGDSARRHHRILISGPGDQQRHLADRGEQHVREGADRAGLGRRPWRPAWLPGSGRTRAFPRPPAIAPSRVPQARRSAGSAAQPDRPPGAPGRRTPARSADVASAAPLAAVITSLPILVSMSSSTALNSALPPGERPRPARGVPPAAAASARTGAGAALERAPGGHLGCRACGGGPAGRHPAAIPGPQRQPDRDPPRRQDGLPRPGAAAGRGPAGPDGLEAGMHPVAARWLDPRQGPGAPHRIGHHPGQRAGWRRRPAIDSDRALRRRTGRSGPAGRVRNYPAARAWRHRRVHGPPGTTSSRAAASGLRCARRPSRQR
jgi:hypothetical protein